MERRADGKTLVFVVDEVGQFVARDVQKMLDLQGIVQSLGRVGRGKMWLVVTSQEKLTELVGGLDGQAVELARLMDRFPLQVHLEPSDISEVTSRRVLAKTSEGAKRLRDLFASEQGRLATHTRVTADVQLPPLNPGLLRGALPASPLPGQPDHRRGVGAADAGGRQPSRGRREPHHHQARPAAPGTPGSRAGREGGGRARDAGPDLRPGLGQHSRPSCGRRSSPFRATSITRSRPRWPRPCACSSSCRTSRPPRRTSQPPCTRPWTPNPGWPKSKRRCRRWCPRTRSGKASAGTGSLRRRRTTGKPGARRSSHGRETSSACSRRRWTSCGRRSPATSSWARRPSRRARLRRQDAPGRRPAGPRLSGRAGTARG